MRLVAALREFFLQAWRHRDVSLFRLFLIGMSVTEIFISKDHYSWIALSMWILIATAEECSRKAVERERDEWQKIAEGMEKIVDKHVVPYRFPAWWTRATPPASKN